VRFTRSFLRSVAGPALASFFKQDAQRRCLAAPVSQRSLRHDFALFDPQYAYSSTTCPVLGLGDLDDSSAVPSVWERGEIACV
jgi:hypothetical protein